MLIDIAKCAEELERFKKSEPEMAGALVATGVSALWFDALGCPDWALEGTSLQKNAALPPQIELLDDLRLIANLASRAGAGRLLQMLAERQRFVTLSPSAPAFIAPTAGKGLSYLLAAINLGNAPFRTRLEVDGGNARVRAFYFPPIGDISSFLSIAGLIYVCRLFDMLVGTSADAGDQEFPIVLHSMDGGRLMTRDVATHLPCRIVTDADSHFLEFPASLLEKANPTANPVAWAEASARLETLKLENNSGATGLLLHAHIAETIVHQKRVPRLNEIAEHFLTSERTLSRRLAKQGLTYFEIVTKIRRDLAKLLLSTDHLSVSEISEQLGFSESSSFVRTFRQWFGVSPGEWRRLNTGNAAVEEAAE